MAGGAHLGANVHCLMIALVFGGVHVLIRNVLAGYPAVIAVQGSGRFAGSEWSESLRRPDSVRGEAESTGSDAVSQIPLGWVGHLEHVLLVRQECAAGLGLGLGIVLVAAALIVMKRRVTSGGVAVADFAEDPGLPRVGVPVLGIERGEGDSGPVIRGRIEVWIHGGRLQVSLRVHRNITQRNVVQVVGRHMAARTEAVDNRARTGQRVFLSADIELRCAFAWFGEGVVVGRSEER